ncbi:MAG: DUF4173 domain-containing protein [Candidatus Shapirobacteria bacterium]|jgi:hypothetical protein
MVAIIITLLYWFWVKGGGGFNLGFSALGTIFFIWLLVKKGEIRKDKYLIALWLMGVAIAWFQTWRNFEGIKAISVVTLVTLGGYLSALGKQPKAIIDLQRIVGSALKTIPDFFRELFGLGTKFLTIKVFSKTKGERWNKILAGAILAVPMVLVFGGLFYSADPIFAKLINSIRLPQINISEKLIGDVVSTVMVLGMSLTLANFRLAKRSENGKRIKGAEEITIAAGVVAGLFLVFSAIQIRYFGISSDELREMGIMYSEYTRKGYAEMLLAAGLAIGLVLWLDKMKKGAAKKIGLALVAETLLIVIAATNRNYLYQAVHGFTRVRLMGFLMSGWMGAALLLVGWKMVKRKSDNRFFRAIIGVTVATVLLANIANIDRMVVKNRLPNLGYGIDYIYVSELSYDAHEIWPWLLDETDEKLRGAPERRWVYYGLRAKADRLKGERERNFANWAGWNGTAVEAEKTMEKLRERLDEEAKEIVISKESET